MIRDRRRYRRHGGWLHVLFITCLIIGGIGAAIGSNTDDPSQAELDQIERCEPLQMYDPLLTDNGWQSSGGQLYPPGCEGVR